MECPRCNREAAADQNYCNGCGLRLRPEEFDAGDDVAWLDGADDLDELDELDGQHQLGGSGADDESRDDLDEGGDVDKTGEVVIWGDDVQVTGEVAVVLDEVGETGEVPVTTVETNPPDSTDVAAAATTTSNRAPQRTAAVAVEAATSSTPWPSDDATTATRPSGGTAVMPQVDAAPAATQTLPQTGLGRMAGRRFRMTATAGLGLAVAAAAVAVLFVPLLSVQSSVTVLLDNADVPDGFRFGSWAVGSLGSNLPMAILICALLALGGAIATGYGKAWGAGLIAGASLSFVGIAALIVGLLQFPITAAYEFARIPTEVPIGLRIVREPGYWFLLGSAGLAVVATFSSFKECMEDRRRNLNPWFAAFGALSVLLLVIGTMIPLNGALISDNWFVIEGPGQAPPELVAGRLVQLGLILISGVGGFLLVRSYGLGLAVGGTIPALWMGMSVLLTGDNPVGPGWRNPGATTMDVHPVTIIEMAAVLALLVLASLSAYGQQASTSDRRRRSR